MKKKICITIILSLIFIQSISPFVYGMGPSTSHPIYEGVKNGDSHFKNVSFSDIKKHWAREAIYEVAALKYMEGSGGKFYPDRYLSNEEILSIMVDILGMEEDEEISNPKSKATREDAAYYLGKALNLTPAGSDEIIKVYNFKDAHRIDKEKLPLIEAVLKKGYMSGANSNSFLPKGYINRAQMAQILFNASDDLAKKRNMLAKEGQIIEKNEVVENGKKVIYFNMENIDGTRNYLKYDKKSKNIFIVQKNKAIYYPDVLQKGDFLKYYIDKNGQVLYGRFTPKKDFNLTGTIEAINYEENTIRVLDYYEKKHTIKINPNTIIEIEGKTSNIAELYYGQEVSVKLKGNDAVRLIAYDEEDPERDGYIIPGTRFKVGDVLFITGNEIEIKSSGEREKYKINSSTGITKNGTRCELFQIKPGDKVMLTFDDIYTSEVSNIKVEDEERHIEGILKGKIELVDERNKELILKEPYIYNEGKWNPYGSHNIRLKTENDKLYEDGEKISLKKIKNRKNEEVYIAFDKSYGNMNISKLLIKSGSSVAHKDKIKDIEYGTGKFVVDNNTMYFHPGTIVVKDNRLVDSLNIDKNQDVFVYSDYTRGQRHASIVSIEGTGILDDRIDGTKLIVYRGKIEDIYDYGIKIGRMNYRLDHLKLTDNKWVEMSGSEKFILTEDTLIYDSELQKIIPSNSFVSSRYINYKDIKDSTLRERVKNDFYKGKTAYFVVRETKDEKEVLALNMTPQLNEYNQNVKTHYSTIGEIKDINVDNGTIGITKVKNYNTLNDRWENGSDETIDLNRSVVLLNDKPMTNDEIYKLRAKCKVYIVKNKDSSKDMGYVLLVED